MPTYEYQCTACDYQFEKYQSIKAGPLRKCPQCGKKVQRLIGGGAGVLFKGSGFYQTDYRSSQYKTDANKDKPSEKKTSEAKDNSAPKPASGKTKKDGGPSKK